ncbi:MAG: chromate efflux transporter [Chloroflexota bacterium]|nr:chromate efflux transporter [Chloroflexota bacterium]
MTASPSPPSPGSLPQPQPTAVLREVATVAFKLGCTAFGGPAAHVAMLREEVVSRRRWMNDQHFVDLLGATNLIPGPNSTEMVIHASYERAGWRGLIVGGSFFIVPAASFTLGFAWLYARYGTTPTGEWLLYGVKPVVIAVVVQAIWSIARTAMRGWLLTLLGLAAFALSGVGASELALLLGAGCLVAAINGWRSMPPVASFMFALPGASWFRGGATALLVPLAATAAEPYSAARLFLLFLKVGATLYGSGYVLIAFLQEDFVERLGWLTEQQLLDAVAVGQFTPGPVFSTATFVGYLAGGWGGAALATVGIFLPAFLLVAVTNPLLPRIRRSRWAAGFLDGVNVAAVGLMAAVALMLGQSAIVDPLTAVLAIVTVLLLIRFKINSAWLVLAGAAIGLAIHSLGP